jgi:apolipoprotein N-acyltransferase
MSMPRTSLQNKPAEIPIVPRWRPGVGTACLAASLLTSVSLWLSYFPVSCGWLAWVALAPWLLLARAELSNRRRYALAGLGAYLFFVASLEWMRAGDTGMVYLWLLLALYMSFYWLVALWLIRRIDRRTTLPLTVTVPVVWTALEFARSELMGGYAWYRLGQTQHNFFPMIQVVDLAGVAAVSFVVAAVNGLLTELLCRVAAVRTWFGMPRLERRPPIVPQFVAVAALVAGVLIYGGWRLNHSEFTAGPRVALLQTSVGQTERNKADVKAKGDALAQQAIEQQDVALAKEAVRQSPRPDLIVLPETAFPSDWFEVAELCPPGPERSRWLGLRDRWCDFCRQFARLAGVPTLLGLNAQTLDANGKSHRYNSAILLTPHGEVGGRYDKIHLLPFGEYLPFKESLPFMERLSPYPDYDYSITPGVEQVRLPLSVGARTYQMGVLICYEIADDDLNRGLVNAAYGPPVDFIVNLTNDGWYMGTSEHAEHLAVSRFAAVECRRAVLRAVNGGISAVIDGDGRVVALPQPTWAGSQCVTGVVSAVVPLDNRSSFYARFGDWLSWFCWGLVSMCCCVPKRSAAITAQFR